MKQGDAVIKVLEDAGHTLHLNEILKRILEQKLHIFKGKTPKISLSTEIGEQCQGKTWEYRRPDVFYQDDKGYYGLLRWKLSEFKLPEEVDDNLSHEGAKKQVTINRYERSREARDKCMSYWGTICLVCDFDFGKVYGDIGKDYIHVHHIIPLSEIKQEYTVDYKNDLRPVCPNCHAMIHKRKPPFTIEKLKTKLRR